MQEISSMKARRAEYETRETSSGLSGDAVEDMSSNLRRLLADLFAVPMVITKLCAVN